MFKLESLHYEFITIERFRSDLMGVDSFIGFCGGIHSVIATTNMYSRLCSKSDEEIIKIVNEVFNEKVEHENPCMANR